MAMGSLSEKIFINFGCEVKKEKRKRKNRVSSESSGWVYQRKTKPNEFFSPVVCCLRALPVVVWGGQ